MRDSCLLNRYCRIFILFLIFALVLFPAPSFAEEDDNASAAGNQQSVNAGSGAETGTDGGAAAASGEAGAGVAGLSKTKIAGIVVGGAAVIGITAAALSGGGGGGSRGTTAHH